MRSSRISLFSLVLSCLISTQLSAQNNFDLDELDDGQLLLNLSASEETEVDQDTLNASLQIVVQGRDRVAAQNEVNAAMTKALEYLEQSSGVEYSTQQYHVYTVEAGRPSRSDIENPVWRAQQSIQLNSKDSTTLLELAGQLQSQGFTLNNLSYSLSSERYEEVSDSLMAAALVKLQNRASQAAEALGKSKAEMIEVNINGSQNMYFRAQPMMMEMAADSGFSNPVAEPGKTQVSLSVSARALVSP
jgi:predicted secreted protein